MKRIGLSLLLVAGLASRLWAETEVGLDFWDAAESGEADRLHLLKVRLDTLNLEQLIAGYDLGGEILLPLFALTSQLELGITPGPAPGTAVGVIIDTERRFDLDASALKVYVNGEWARLDSSHLYIGRSEIYVSASLLEQWLPLDIEVDRYSSFVRLTAREPLPIQQRIERERRLAQAKTASRRIRNYPLYANSYQLFSVPVIDQTVSGHSRQVSGVNYSGAHYSSYAAGDLLYMEGSAYVAGTQLDPLIDYRFTLGRKDPYERLLGPFQATQFSLGHQFAFSSPLISSNSLALGASVSNFPLFADATPETYSIQGEVPPDWEVELYRDSALLGYRRRTSNTLYSFEDVPLFNGPNEFRLVFYGPYGQRREETVIVNLGDFFLEPGELRYRMSAGVDSGDALRASGTSEFGIYDRVTASLGVDSQELNGRQIEYGHFGARTYWGPVYGFGRAVFNSDGGRAEELGGSVGSRQFNIGARYTLLHDFQSDIFSDYLNPVTSRFMASIGGMTPRFRWLPQVSNSLSYSRDQLRRGKRDVVNHQLTTAIDSFTISNQLDWIFPVRTATSRIITAGSFLVARDIEADFPIGVYSSLYYYLRPQWELNSFLISADTTLAEEYYFRAGLTHFFSANYNQYAATAAKTFDPITLSLSADFGGSNFGVMLKAAYSLGYEPRRRQFDIQAKSRNSRGVALVRVFLDSNGNGLMEHGELPLPNVGLAVNGTSVEGRTDRDGRLRLDDLVAYQPTDVAVGLSTLEDPTYLPSVGGISFVPRPGTPMLIDLPVVQTGEIDGSIYFVNGNERSEVGDVEVELVDRATELVVQRSKSVFDGFYLFTKVKPGKYIVRISRRNLTDRLSVEPKLIEIHSGNLFLNGIDFTVKRTPQ